MEGLSHGNMDTNQDAMVEAGEGLSVDVVPKVTDEMAKIEEFLGTA